MGHLMVVGHVLCIDALQDTPGLLFQHFWMNTQRFVGCKLIRYFCVCCPYDLFVSVCRCMLPYSMTVCFSIDQDFSYGEILTSVAAVSTVISCLERHWQLSVVRFSISISISQGQSLWLLCWQSSIFCAYFLRLISVLVHGVHHHYAENTVLGKSISLKIHHVNPT